MADGNGSIAANSASAGLEYQIEVTVWVALDLLLARRATSALVVEPTSQEDIEAELEDDDPPSETSTDGFHLTVQVKSRNSGRWTAAAFADVLDGGRRDGAGRHGPRRRRRALELLSDDMARRYVFVTDASLDGELDIYRIGHVEASANAVGLPGRLAGSRGHARYSGRIGIIPDLKVSQVRMSTDGLLMRYGLVPRPMLEGCRSNLVERVRARLLGHVKRELTYEELVEVVRVHGGTDLAAWGASFVPPSNLHAVRERLEGSHAVILVGPPGMGRTTTADHLAAEYRLRGNGWEVIADPSDAHAIRARLDNRHPILFHIRDPWGRSELAPGADNWSGLLPDLFLRARPDKKFIVTSPSHIIHEGRIGSTLERFVVTLGPDHYDAETRGRIYDLQPRHPADHGQPTGHAFRDHAVHFLRTPREVMLFCGALAAERSFEWASSSMLLRAAQSEGIAEVVSRQILSGPEIDRAVSSAAVVWGLATGFEAVPRRRLLAVRRKMGRLDSSFRADVEDFLDSMIAAQNIVEDDEGFAMRHPQVERGFRMALEARRSTAGDALGLLIQALVGMDGDGISDDWSERFGATIANRLRASVLLHSAKLDIDLQAGVVGPLVDQLEADALHCHPPAFLDAFRRLLRLAGDARPTSRLAGLLVEGSGSAQYREGANAAWSMPNDWENRVAELRDEPLCRALADRFIRHALPVTHRRYDDGIVLLLGSIVPDACEAFLDAALDVAVRPDGTCRNVEPIVRGALSGDRPAYERIIEAGLSGLRGAAAELLDRDREIRKARELVNDAPWAEHLEGLAANLGEDAARSLREAIRLRRPVDGHDWLASHFHVAELLAPWLDVAEREGALSSPETEALLALATTEGELAQAWLSAWEQDPGLTDRLVRDMARPGRGRVLRRAWLFAFSALHDASWFHVLEDVALRTFGPARIVELAVDLATTSLEPVLPEGTTVSAQLTKSRSADLDRLCGWVVAGTSDSEAGRLHPADLDVHRLAVLCLGEVGPDVRAALLKAVPPSPDLLPHIDAALGEGDEDVAMAAVAALSRWPFQIGDGRTRKALSHASHRVRTDEGQRGPPASRRARRTLGSRRPFVLGRVLLRQAGLRARHGNPPLARGARCPLPLAQR